MILPIIKGPDPRLYTVSRPVDLATDRNAIQDLVDTFRSTQAARGLAAVQVGHLIRACVVRTPSDLEILLLNPLLIESFGPTQQQKETCLSYPWLSGVAVDRPTEIIVRFNEGGATDQSQKFTSITARCILHEIDHMDGVTIETHRRRK